jgi:hypothetical protein
MATTNRGLLRAARDAFAQARSNLVDRLFNHEKATAELSEAKRRLVLESDLEPFQRALSQAESALTRQCSMRAPSSCISAVRTR